MIQLLFRHLKMLISVFLGVGILTYLFCLFVLTPQYRSTAIMYPPNTHAFPHLVAGGMRFGYDKEIGEHVEILQSIPVKTKVIERFNLGEHYEIEKDNPYYQDLLFEEYDENIGVSRSLNKSIVITVLDKDPKISAQIANSLIELSDLHKSEIIKSNLRFAAEAAEKNYLTKNVIVNTMADSLNRMRENGEVVWNLGEERKSGKYIHYEIQYFKELDALYGFKNRYEELVSLLSQEVPKSYIVSEAYPTSKSVFPKKGLTAILMGGICSLSVLLYLKLKEV